VPRKEQNKKKKASVPRKEQNKKKKASVLRKEQTKNLKRRAKRAALKLKKQAEADRVQAEKEKILAGMLASDEVLKKIEQARNEGRIEGYQACLATNGALPHGGQI